LGLASRVLLALLVLAAVGVSAAVAAGAALVFGLTLPVVVMATAAVAAVVGVVAPPALGRAFARRHRFDVRDALRPAYARLSRSDAQAAPNLLLLPLYEAAPFRGRADQLVGLVAWCAADKISGLVLIHGPGGMGKSRLAAKLCRTQAEKGWLVGFLKSDLASKTIPEVCDSLAAVPKPVLIVVDYAETRPDTVAMLIDTLTEKRTQRRWRVLLVARTTGDWWPYLSSRVHGEAVAVVKTASPYELGPIERSPEGRQTAYEEAARHFADLLCRSSDGIGEPDLSDRRFDRPLWLHMAALSVLFKAETDDGETGGTASASPDKLLEGALLREHKHWRDTALAAELDIDDGLAARAVAVATLLSAASGDEAEEALRAVGSDKMDCLRVANWLRKLYPGDPDSWFHPLEPDLLGEALLAKILSDAPSVVDRALVAVIPERAERPLTVLTRMAHQNADARAALERGIAARFDVLRPVALEVARGSGDPLGKILADALKRNPRAEIAEAVVLRLPESTVAFSELAVVATETSLDAARKRDEEPEEIARLLNNLSVQLSDLGRREAALAAIEEAVTTYRALAAERPDAFLPDLAMSLNNLSNRLSDLGRREAALAAIEEAVTIRRGLAAERPDAFLPDLAMSLNNLSNRLSDLGRREAALAAIEEAVTTYRALAAERPDAFLPDVAMSLNNLSVQLSDLGRREAALAAIEEAVTTYRALAAERPDVFQDKLVTSLRTLARLLDALGRHPEAEAATMEADGLV
jgi:tetratricopeptide (TPR) repeat protein